jgi:hypothetical protein
MYMSSLFLDYPVGCLKAPPFLDKYHQAIFSAVSSVIETTLDGTLLSCFHDGQARKGNTCYLYLIGHLGRAVCFT